MLPCAPYITNICQSVQLIPEEEISSPEQSPKHKSVKKKETEVRVTDVTSTQVDLLNIGEDVISSSFNENIKVITADVTKVLTTVKPESPDVTRAAKKFEQDKQVNFSVDDIENVFLKSCEATDKLEEPSEQQHLGAISKTSYR